MKSTFKTINADFNGEGQIELPSSLGVTQVPAPESFSASSVSALQSMFCNASSSVPASQMTTQNPLSNHSEERSLLTDPRSLAFYQDQSVDNGTALYQSIQKLQRELLEINGRLQQEKTNLSDEVKVKTSQTVEESSGAGHKPNIIIAPCPARGMPFDHNYKTANFTISDETGHGDELVCSYSSCQKVGIKFRYCGFCKLPVPKRNFHKFHSHSEQIKEQEKSAPKQKTPLLNCKSQSLEETPLCAEISSGSNNHVNKKRNHSEMTQKTLQSCTDPSRSLTIKKEVKPTNEGKNSALELKYQSHEGIPLCTEMSRDIDGPANKKRKRSKTKQKTQDKSKIRKSMEIRKGLLNSLPDSDFDDKNHLQWVELLHERPSKSRKKMSVWLTKVLQVSEACMKSYHSQVDKVSVIKARPDTG